MDENEVLRQIAASNEASMYGAGSYGAASSGSGGGWLDQLTAIGTGYLSRRIDVDIQRRMATTGTVGLAGNQRPIYSTPLAGLTNATGGLNLSAVLPIALLAIAAVVVLKKL